MSSAGRGPAGTARRPPGGLPSRRRSADPGLAVLQPAGLGRREVVGVRGLRVVLVVLAVSAVSVGGWALPAAAVVFLSVLPGLGYRWVGVDDPFK